MILVMRRSDLLLGVVGVMVLIHDIYRPDDDVSSLLIWGRR